MKQLLTPERLPLWHQCEVPECPRFGRYQGESGRDADIGFCPSLTRSGHQRLRIAAVQTDP
jgi:hypothetical protein